MFKTDINKDVKFEYQHGKDLIIPGTLVKIKNVRGDFKFEKYVNHYIYNLYLPIISK